jgi:hypothetical protein
VSEPGATLKSAEVTKKLLLKTFLARISFLGNFFQKTNFYYRFFVVKHFFAVFSPSPPSLNLTRLKMCSRMLVSVAAAAALAAVLVSARPQGAYELPNGFQEILSAPLQQSFTCDGLPYG